MAYENIRLKHYNFTIKDGYFFHFSHTNDILYQKNTSGGVVFTYPLTTSLGNIVVKDLCWDGVNFWTLQQHTSSTGTIIKKWRVVGAVCNLISSHVFGDTFNYYSSSTFSIESFGGVLGQALPYGSTSITLSGILAQGVPAGSVLTIGPNVDGFYEEVTVTGTLSVNNYGLDFFTSLDHLSGEPVSFVNNLWLFNNYTGTSLQGSLQCYNMVNKSWIKVIMDSDFSNITGSTFYIDSYSNYYILYVFGTSVRFFNIITGVVDKTLLIDNIKVNGTTVIPVYGLEVVDDTLYRLQNFMKYYGVDYSQSTYNYQCTPIRSFVDSISMEVYPKILPSNGVNIATIKVAIQDQYGDPAQYKVAHLSDDDDYGYITTTAPLTNLQGVATSYYRAGLTARKATITALATQYD